MCHHFPSLPPVLDLAGESCAIFTALSELMALFLHFRRKSFRLPWQAYSIIRHGGRPSSEGVRR